MLGAVIAFAITVAVFSFLSPKGPDPVAAPVAAPSSDAGMKLLMPAGQLRMLKPGVVVRRATVAEMVNDDAGLPDAATP